MLYATLASLVDRMDTSTIRRAGVIQWGAPIPVFGDVATARVATLGINPSNREFMDEGGDELQGPSRRFHTLRSLNLESWEVIEAAHLRLIEESCRDYFQRAPYDRWFRKIDTVVAGTGCSYYSTQQHACHLDLIPFATAKKWTELSSAQRSRLLHLSYDALAVLLRDSSIEVLILNGRSVVEEFAAIAGVTLEVKRMPEWTLPRQGGEGVAGVAYHGILARIGDIPLGRSVLVLGYNHNLQSSFGVTREVVHAIRAWIASATRIMTVVDT
ncbi:hypothetical protein [Gemmatimonas aurantiaca]|uniref:hypothetical protein n=1 Tax=Gemmatimonas aurantiaca TaxID=173480 RepID=UPI00301D3AA8